MITWVTVWVLTITNSPWRDMPTSTQFTYATESICMKQGERLKTNTKVYSCNFQQVPIYVPK